MPAHPEPSSDDLSPLRKQLILSQVEILELEDVREELRMKLAEQAQLLTELQGISDRAFAATRQAEASATEALRDQEAAQAELEQSRRALETRQSEIANLHVQINGIEQALMAAEALSARHAKRIEMLDSEIRAMKSSRSWRWTAVLRSIERRLKRQG